VPRPVLCFRLVGVVAVIEFELFGGDRRLADAKLDYAFVHLPAAALAAVRPKLIDDYSQRSTGVARPAARPKEHVPETPPVLEQPFLILGWRHGGDLLVFHPPDLLRQVAALARQCREAEDGCHGRRGSRIVVSSSVGSITCSAG